MNRAEGTWRSDEESGTRQGDAEFKVCPTGFRSCFVPVFPHCAPFPTFVDANVYLVPLYVESMC